MESGELNRTVPAAAYDTPTVVKVRCPNCFKLYGVDHAEIKDSRPNFECIKCQTRFWFPYPECLEQKEILGFPVEWLQPTTAEEPQVPPPSAPGGASAETPAPMKNAENLKRMNAFPLARKFHCPRCQAEYSAGDPDCPKCGVVFAKLDILEDHRGVPGSANLRRQWRQVIDQYPAIERHRQFIQACQKEGNLAFATHQYAKLLQAHSGDELALKMQNEISALIQVSAGYVAPAKKSLSRRLFPRISTMIMMIGGAVIGLGFILQNARNLIGLGVAVVFFTIAIEWFYRRAL